MKILGKATDPKFWESVREKDCYKKFREELLDLWKQTCETPIEALRYSDFIDYKKRGNRDTFQGPYFKRRCARDASTLLSLIYPEEEKYINRLMDEIYAMCDEYTWCISAHQKEFEKILEDKVDLFASETAFALSEVYLLLGDRLEPLIKNRILYEVERRVVKPFVESERCDWWERGTMNWTAVCICSVALAMMHLFPEKAKELIPRFNASMDTYLTGFNDDGICLEGVNYWHYGFGFFTMYADAVKKFTDGEVDYFKNEKVKAVACFMQNMYLTTGKTGVSFADSGMTPAFHLGLLHRLKEIYPEDVVVYSPESSYNYDSCGRFGLHLRSALWLNEDYYYNPEGRTLDEHYFAKDSQWFIKHSPNYGFAAKGGHNNEPHNHNDVGTFIYAKNGRQVIVDLGSGRYSRQYFAKETRYQMLACSSKGHNVPIINDTAQSFGPEFAAKEFSFENGVLSMEISGAYDVEGLEAINRSFSFGDNSVTVHDSFKYSGDGEITDRIVTIIEPKLEDGNITIEDTSVTFDSSKCSVNITTGYKDDSNRQLCYLINFVPNAGVTEIEFTIS